MDLPGAEDWLSNEKFDFNINLNLSKSSAEEEDDEEVFIGPVTHKEKCMAVIVQEKENIKTVERLNPEEQALILRESALINLKIKNEGTPGRRNTMASPAVAIVHPMRRQAIQNEGNKENVQKNKIEIDSKKIPNMSSESSKKRSKRVSMAIKPSKSLTEFSEPPSVSRGTKLGNSTQQKRLKKQQVIPKPGSISKSKSGGGIPSLLPSRPKNFSENLSTNPMKPSTQSVSGISQPQLKVSAQATCGISQKHLKLSARKCSYDGTPTTNKLQAKSSQRQSLGGKGYFASIGTPNKSKAINKPSEKSEAKQNDLITPIVHSSRKSIIGRQLIPEVKRSKTPSVDKLNQTNSIQENKILEDVQLDKKGDDHVAPTEEVDSSNSDILQKYEKGIDEKSKNINNEFMLQDNKEIDTNDTNIKIPIGNEHITNMPLYIPSSNVVNSNENDKIVCKEKMLPVVPSPPPLLIDIFDCVEPVHSPAKLNNIDPFETGNTPPPLIQLDVVLEPEKLQEVNLIKF